MSNASNGEYDTPQNEKDDEENGDPIQDLMLSKKSEHDIEAEVAKAIPKESKISRTLSEKTIKTVIILILVMLFFMPFFQLETYISPPTSYEKQLYSVMKLYQTEGNSTNYKIAHDEYISIHTSIENNIVKL